MRLRVERVSGTWTVTASASADDLGLVDERHAVSGGRLLGHVRVVAEDLHLHRPSAVGDGHADLAQADDAQRLAAQLDAR